VVPADAKRRDDHRRARRQRRPYRRGRSRQTARPSGLRSPAPRRSLAREERRRSERIRLGLAEGRRRGDRDLEVTRRGRRGAIGALGLSTGADTLIQVAGQGTDLKAVVADGTYAGSLEDGQRITGFSAITPFMALEFATVGATSGTTPGPAIEDMVKRVTSPLLLVAAGPDEKNAGELYDRAARDRPVDVWYLPDVGHTAAIRQVAAEYEQRVTAFFDDALPGS
jgi:hypothetical protein